MLQYTFHFDHYTGGQDYIYEFDNFSIINRFETWRTNNGDIHFLQWMDLVNIFLAHSYIFYCKDFK